MGKVLEFLSPVLGLKSLFDKDKPKATAPAPVDTEEAIGEGEDIKKKARAKRASLFKTAGGVAGQELEPEQISKRPTLLGN